MINPKLLQTLEDRLNILQAQLFGTCKTYDGKADLYSFIAAAMYNMDIDDCREYRQDGTLNPYGKELRNRVKQFLIPIIAVCGGVEAEHTPNMLNGDVKQDTNSYSFDYDDFYPNGIENSQPIDPCKLAYILLSRGILTPRDFGFLTGHESFENWKKYNAEHKNYIIARMVRLADIDED